MTSLAPFFQRVKPALDAFLRTPSRDNLQNLENELFVFKWQESKMVHIHILLPLVLQMEQLEGLNQDLRTGLLNCIRLVLSNIYLNEVKGLCTILAIVLKQLRDLNEAKMLPNLSEEIKLASVLCISEALQRSTSDVLEQFYANNFMTLIGQILLTLVEIVELDKYRKLRLKSIECLMSVFYVHDKAETTDIVLRCQVADTLFIYLPKVLSVIFKTAMSDDTIGENLKSTAIKAMGRILNIIYEQTNETDGKKSYDSKEFRKLIENSKKINEDDTPHILHGTKIKKDQLKQHMERMQSKGRSSQWFKETSLRLKPMFKEMSVHCSHTSTQIRTEHARMCSLIIENCAHNLKENFVILLENLIALSEDEDEKIRTISANSLRKIREHTSNISIFDEAADMLFDEHSKKLVQILHRKHEFELYTELLFLKGLFRNIGPEKFYSLLSLPAFLESFCMAIITTVDMEATCDLLNEEYALRQINEHDYQEFAKFRWRHFKFLDSSRCISLMEEICFILGGTEQVNRLLFDYFVTLLQTQQSRMNEILLILSWMSATPSEQNTFVETIIAYILDENHWHLALYADAKTQLKVNKPSYWFVDTVPGIYSGVEIRIQDNDSDDEEMEVNERVGIAEAQQNVLHTCIILEALGHCANRLGRGFEKYIFHSLHKVLLKVASSNTMVYQAAMFCLLSMQKVLGYSSPSNFIEAHTDYLSYHLNMTLRKSPESSSAVDILSVILQLSSRNTVPHLESIFQTIRDECSRAQQEKHISAYLRVFHAFLINVNRWQFECIEEVQNELEIDEIVADEHEMLSNWLEILEKQETLPEVEMADEQNAENQENEQEQEQQKTVELPRHIEIVKGIIEQAIKFVSSSSQAHQIQSLECLIAGMPQLANYENALLPLVHMIWQPLVEKFRQNDALVLNRCFTLLNVLSTCAKDFILKRSLDDVMPHLRHFLQESSGRNTADHGIMHSGTQLYKLQLKLLQEFSNLIKTMTIDGKFLNDIAEVISLYLSNKQPKELQFHAVNFFIDLKSFNGPLLYIIAMKRKHLTEYTANVKKIMKEYGVID